MSPESSGKSPAAHTDKAFEADLREVREKLLAMGGKVEEQIAKSMRALTERDSELGELVMEGDLEINRLEVDIDDLCRRILALRQPAASSSGSASPALWPSSRRCSSWTSQRARSTPSPRRRSRN